MIPKAWFNKIINKHLGETSIDTDIRLFNFKKSTKNLAYIDEKINATINDYKPKTETEYDKKRVVSILNEIRKSMLDFYVSHETIFNLIEKYQFQGSDKVLSKYSKHGWTIREVEDQFNELCIYSKHQRSIGKIEKQSKYLKSQLEETIGERV